MPFLAQKLVEKMNFAHVGSNVKISDSARFYFPENIYLSDDCRVDDFAVLSGHIKLGKNVHVALQCNLVGGQFGVEMKDYSGCAYGVTVIAQTDDYSGEALTNPTVPNEFTGVTGEKIVFGKHSIVGSHSVLLPGAKLGEGVAIGAMSLVRKPVEAWTIYSGNPLRKLANRSKNILRLEEQLMNQM